MKRKFKKPHTVRIGSKSYRCKIDTTHTHTHTHTYIYIYIYKTAHFVALVSSLPKKVMGLN